MATLASPPDGQADTAGVRHDAGNRLMDGFGRTITYLRLSITDRCDLRCRYCMAEHMTFVPRAQLLSVDELAGIADTFIARGITTIRLTGGEPLTRRDFPAIVSRLGERIGHGLDALTLTTNATQLARHAAAIAAAGVRRINVSVDTLDAADFAHVTRGGRLADVLGGIDAAVGAGLSIRINMVAMAGFNDRQLAPMLDWCARGGHDLALIESMPMGGDMDAMRSVTHVPLSQFIASALGNDVPVRAISHSSNGPARYVQIGASAVRVGLITPISNNFCSQCNRIRMTATGQVHGCLGDDAAIDIAAAWRRGGADAVAPLIDRLMRTKVERHQFVIGTDVAERGPMRHMSVTGG